MFSGYRPVYGLCLWLTMYEHTVCQFFWQNARRRESTTANSDASPKPIHTVTCWIPFTSLNKPGTAESPASVLSGDQRVWVCFYVCDLLIICLVAFPVVFPANTEIMTNNYLRCCLMNKWMENWLPLVPRWGRGALWVISQTECVWLKCCK